MSDCKNRLDEIVIHALRHGKGSFSELTAIMMCVQMVGSLEPIGSLEKVRQSLIANFDGSKDDNSAFLDMYDWDRIIADLEKARNTMIRESGISLDHNAMAQELETMARWVRLSGEVE